MRGEKDTEALVGVGKWTKETENRVRGERATARLEIWGGRSNGEERRRKQNFVPEATISEF